MKKYVPCIVLSMIVATSLSFATASAPKAREYDISEEQNLIQTEPVVETISLGECKLTAYCKENYPHICNNGDSSRTATGTVPVAGRTVAVDPEIIPYGSEVIINGHTYIAEDTGSAIKGLKVDILFETHLEALAFGIQYANVSYIPKEGY
jgi:3D (Asp-Asp-Asp) domain-containing protein